MDPSRVQVRRADLVALTRSSDTTPATRQADLGAPWDAPRTRGGGGDPRRSAILQPYGLDMVAWPPVADGARAALATGRARLSPERDRKTASSLSRSVSLAEA